MNIELICWLVAWVLSIEGIFIWRYIKDSDFGFSKILGIIFGSFFMLMQSMIVYADRSGEKFFIFTEPHYIWLIYEFLIILSIGLFIYFNKKIADWIDKKEEKGKKKSKKSGEDYY